MGVVHSSTDSNFLQEVKELEKQKKEAKDDDKRQQKKEAKDDDKKKDLTHKLKLKTLERDLAVAKEVRWRNLTL